MFLSGSLLSYPIAGYVDRDDGSCSMGTMVHGREHSPTNCFYGYGLLALEDLFWDYRQIASGQGGDQKADVVDGF